MTWSCGVCEHRWPEAVPTCLECLTRERDAAEARVEELTEGGIGLIAAERQRQLAEEGWSVEHDVEHFNGQLARAAAVYALPNAIRESFPWRHGQNTNLWRRLWPWEEKWFKPGDRERELVKAGALIAAELDRLARAVLVGDSE